MGIQPLHVNTAQNTGVFEQTKPQESSRIYALALNVLSAFSAAFYCVKNLLYSSVILITSPITTLIAKVLLQKNTTQELSPEMTKEKVLTEKVTEDVKPNSLKNTFSSYFTAQTAYSVGKWVLFSSSVGLLGAFSFRVSVLERLDLFQFNKQFHIQLSDKIFPLLTFPAEYLGNPMEYRIGTFDYEKSFFYYAMYEEVIFRGLVQSCLLNKAPKFLLSKVAPKHTSFLDSKLVKVSRIAFQAYLFAICHSFRLHYWNVMPHLIDGILLGALREQGWSIARLSTAHYLVNTILHHELI